MPEITVTVSETIEVPEGTVLVRSPAGIVTRFQLPNRMIVRPWNQYEGALSADSDPLDLSFDELLQMDVLTGCDTDVELVSDLETLERPRP